VGIVATPSKRFLMFCLYPMVPLVLMSDLKKRTTLLGLVLFMLCLTPLVVVRGDVPTVISVEEVGRGDDNVLVIEIRHSSPSSSHYVDSFEVEVGEEVYTIEDLGGQSATVFTVEHVLGSPDTVVRVRAHCNLHGWSQWTQLGEEPTDTGGGIPGFGYAAILIGLTSYIVAVRVGARS
jgi:desulfoferrodoxin (superoxide reductase-like protein)